MDVKAEQLDTFLQNKLAPVFLIASDEHLLLEESCGKIKHYAKQQGFTETERLIVEKGFRWTDLADANASMSLFGDKKIIDLRIPNGKPGTEGSDALIRYLDNPSPDNLLLIRCPQLNKQTLNSKWAKAINAKGVVTVIWKVKPAQLPSWIQQRGRQYKLAIEREGAQILAERVEGNLLAASQEIEKLSLLFPAESQILPRQIIQTVANSSRYDVFSLIEHAIEGQMRKAITMLRGLREERTDLTIISWALRNEIETLMNLAELSAEQGIAKSFKDLRVWPSKQNAYSRALKRLKQKQLGELILDLAELDKTIKGRAKITANSSADDLCEALVIKLAST